MNIVFINYALRLFYNRRLLDAVQGLTSGLRFNRALTR